MQKQSTTTTPAPPPPARAADDTQFDQRMSIATIYENDINTRKRFNEQKMKELTDSVRSKGVLEPIIVRTRPLKGLLKYQVVCGARRFRATIRAELKTIPVIIREYTDAEALEVIVIENSQREDPHPLEEAEGFAALLKQPNYSPAVLAAKIGHDESYISRRLRLIELVDELKAAFYADRINVSHAYLLARLPAAQQAEALKEFLFVAENVFEAGKWKRGKGEAISVSKLDSLIKERLLLDLSTAAWKKDDATLVPAAGACTVCPKRSGANAVLFDDMKKGDYCLDRACFDSKRTALLVQIETAVAAEAGRKVVRISSNYYLDQKLRGTALTTPEYRLVTAGKSCDKTEPAIYMDGDHFSKAVHVCRNKNCSVHFPSGSIGSSAPKDYWAERRKKLKSKIDWESRLRVLKAVLAKSYSTWEVPPKQMAVMIEAMVGQGARLVAKILDLEVGKKQEPKDAIARYVKEAKPADLPRVLVAAALVDATNEFTWAKGPELKRLHTFARIVGVDPTAIGQKTARELSVDFNARHKRAMEKKAAEQARAKKKAKPAKKAKAARA